MCASPKERDHPTTILTSAAFRRRLSGAVYITLSRADTYTRTHHLLASGATSAPAVTVVSAGQGFTDQWFHGRLSGASIITLSLADAYTRTHPLLQRLPSSPRTWLFTPCIAAGYREASQSGWVTADWSCTRASRLAAHVQHGWGTVSPSPSAPRLPTAGALS